MFPSTSFTWYHCSPETIYPSTYNLVPKCVLVLPILSGNCYLAPMYHCTFDSRYLCFPVLLLLIQYMFSWNYVTGVSWCSMFSGNCYLGSTVILFPGTFAFLHLIMKVMKIGWLSFQMPSNFKYLNYSAGIVPGDVSDMFQVTGKINIAGFSCDNFSVFTQKI